MLDRRLHDSRAELTAPDHLPQPARCTHAVVADHRLHRGLGVLEHDAPRSSRLAVDGDGGVHLDLFDPHPPGIQQHFGGQIAGRVKALRKDSVLHDLLQARRLFVLRGRAERPCALHDAVQDLGRVGVHLHAADRRIRLVLADLELLDGEVAAQVHDHVHHLRQHHRVDDVALQDQSRTVPPLGHARAPAATLILDFNAAASRAGLSAYRMLRLAATRHEAGAPFPAERTAASTSPPCAPTPGRRKGRSVTARTCATSRGAVAPTTNPMLPLPFRSSASSATWRYSGLPADSRSCRSAAPGFEVRQRMYTPRAAYLVNWRSESEPR